MRTWLRCDQSTFLPFKYGRSWKPTFIELRGKTFWLAGDAVDLRGRHVCHVRWLETMGEKKWGDKRPNVEQAANPSRHNFHPCLRSGGVHRGDLPLATQERAVWVKKEGEFKHQGRWCTFPSSSTAACWESNLQSKMRCEIWGKNMGRQQPCPGARSQSWEGSRYHGDKQPYFLRSSHRDVCPWEGPTISERGVSEWKNCVCMCVFGNI